MPTSVLPSPLKSPVTGIASGKPKSACGAGSIAPCTSQTPSRKRSGCHSVRSIHSAGRNARPPCRVLRRATRGCPASITLKCHVYSPPPPVTIGAAAGTAKNSGGGTGCGNTSKNGGGKGGGGSGVSGGGGMIVVTTCTSLKLLSCEC